MPKKIDPKVKERCVQQMLEHAAEYPNPTATAEVVAKRNGVGAETVRRWYLQAQVDSGQRQDGRIDCCSVAETWYPCSSQGHGCLLYTSPSPRDRQKSRMPSSA